MLATQAPPSTTHGRQTSPSPSPSSRQTVGFLSSFGARISRRFSKGDVHGEEGDGRDGRERGEGRDGEESVGSGSPLNRHDRSLSRGREALQSTGRGGFGNIRTASVSRDRHAQAQGGPDDFSTTRGREREVNLGAGNVATPGSVYSTGRGGAGNLRSPSREPRNPLSDNKYEKEVIEQYTAAHSEGPVSTGRGGLGNIARSRSREPSGVRATSRDPPRSVSRTRHATGRGGAGNVREGGGDGYEGNREDEVERGKVGAGGHKELPHSTGRGGIANITEQEEPALERPSVGHREGEWGSTGRGGAGNLVRN